MDKTHSYLKVELYDKPAWEAVAVLIGTLTDAVNVNVNLQRGLSPHTATFEIYNTGTDCDYAGKGVVISAYSNNGSEEITEEAFKGFIPERQKIIDAKSLTHVGWIFQCEDVMATWEAYQYEINMYDENGIDDSDIARNSRPPKFTDFGASYSGFIRYFNYTGNAMGFFGEIRKQGGHVSSGRGDTADLSESDNVQILKVIESVPECEGVKISYKKNNNSGTGTDTVKTIFMAKSQQWWVPIAWSEEEDEGYILHIVYQTTIQHQKVLIGGDTENTYVALYFDDESQSFSTVDAIELTQDYDYTLLGDNTLITPTNNSVSTGILIHKTYEFEETPESEETAGASLINKFKEEMPEIMSLHIQTGSATPKPEEYEIGDAPYNEEDAGYITRGLSATYMDGENERDTVAGVGTYAMERLIEMQYTNEKQYQYTFSLVPKIPIPDHGNEKGGDLFKQISTSSYELPPCIVESTSLSWNGDGININSTIRYKSEKTAAYKRVSKYNLPRYFKKQMKTQLNKIADADYAKIDGDSIVFTIDGEEVKISLTDNILTDDGIVRW